MLDRKPILLVDNSSESNEAIGIEYTLYDIKKFEESCCVELPSAKAPLVFAVEGVFEGLN